MPLKTACFTFLMLIGSFLPWPVCAAAQEPSPYLTRATLYISVDDWADIWLNGHPIVDSLPYTGAEKGYKTFKCLPEHLCYFKKENILAIQASDRTNPSDPNNDFSGIAYYLKLEFSDGSRNFISSNEAGQHAAYYLPDWRLGTPRGWQNWNYDDRNWVIAKGTGTSIPLLAQLSGPEFGGEVQFLSSDSYSSKVQRVGERHLFRRKFYLNISSAPGCATPISASLPKPARIASLSPPFVDRPMAPTITPTMTRVFYPASAVFTVTPMVFPKKEKTFLPSFSPIPISTPFPTLAFVPVSSSRPEPSQQAAPQPSPKPTVFSPTPSLQPTVSEGEGQTIVFGGGAANIYLSFADGPGTYRLEVFDTQGRHLRYLFEKWIVAQDETWVDWDGKDDQGQDVNLGEAVVVFSKNGIELKKIMVIKTKASE